MKKKQERLIVETSSDTKRLHELQQRIAELERIVGQKQIEIDFKDKMIEIAEEMYSVDIKKKARNCTFRYFVEHRKEFPYSLNSNIPRISSGIPKSWNSETACAPILGRMVWLKE